MCVPGWGRDASIADRAVTLRLGLSGLGSDPVAGQVRDLADLDEIGVLDLVGVVRGDVLPRHAIDGARDAGDGVTSLDGIGLLGGCGGRAEHGESEGGGRVRWVQGKQLDTGSEGGG